MCKSEPDKILQLHPLTVRFHWCFWAARQALFIKGGNTLRKIFFALVFVTIFATSSFAAINADEAYRIAKTPNDDSFIGVWKAYAMTAGEKDVQNSALCAIIPSTDNPKWDYVVILLEDFYVFKSGEVKGRLRKTERPEVLWAKSVEYISTTVTQSINGPVTYADGILNYTAIQPPLRSFMIMTKGDYIIEDLEPEEPKDESWREFLAPSKP